MSPWIKQFAPWILGVLLVSFYVMSLYQRATQWRFAPELRIAVMSEPLFTLTQAIVGDLAEVRPLDFPLTVTGARLKEQLADVHLVLVPRVEDGEKLPLGEDMRLLSMEDVFSPSFQYQLLRSNQHFFAYAQPEMEDRVIRGIRDKLVDVDVVRAGKYEVATKAMRRRIKETGGFLEESRLVPAPEELR